MSAPFLWVMILTLLKSNLDCYDTIIVRVVVADVSHIRAREFANIVVIPIAASCGFGVLCC